jgi:hypothetical protein
VLPFQCFVANDGFRQAQAARRGIDGLCPTDMSIDPTKNRQPEVQRSGEGSNRICPDRVKATAIGESGWA